MIRSLLLELRRLWRGRAGETEIRWPRVPEGVCLNPSSADFAAYRQAPLALTWERRGDTPPALWQAQVRGKLRELLGSNLPPAADAVSVEGKNAPLPGGLRRRTFYLPTALDRHAPVTVVWLEADAAKPLPVMLCFQGHTSGAHVSWGEARVGMDLKRIANGGDYAIQAVARGFVAVCVEQIGFGERGERAVVHRWEHPCVDACNRALLWGSTVLGARVADAMAVVDWLRMGGLDVPAVDPDRVYAMGNSAGGETALFLAALDTRICGAIASGCVGDWRRTSGTRKACPDTVIPGVLNWMEYGDVEGLCAPRPLLVVSCREDNIYPFALADACATDAARVYAALGASGNLRTVEGEAGHRFYPEASWPVFLDMTGRRTA